MKIPLLPINGGPGADDVPRKPNDGRSKARMLARDFQTDLDICEDLDTLECLLATSGPLLEQVRTLLPEVWLGDADLGFLGLEQQILNRRKELTP